MMTRKAQKKERKNFQSMTQNKTQTSCCPLVSSPRKRAAANKLAATVKDALPAGLAQPALRALAAAGYTSLDQFTALKEADLLRLHGMGPKAIDVIREALQKLGKSFLA